MKKRDAIVVGLFIVVVVLFGLNQVLGSNTQVAEIPVNDKTWSESGLFTNVEYQAAQEQELSEEYEAFDIKYSLQEPYVKVNPYGINPLSAYVMFDSEKPVKYSYTVHSEDEANNFVYNNQEYSKTVKVPVIGLFENTNNKVTISIEDESGFVTSSEVVIATGNADYYPIETKVQSELDDETLNGWYFDAFYNGFDIDGNIRYNLNAGVEDNPMKFKDGSFFVKVDNYQTIYELNIMGKIINTYKTPSAEYNFHHDVVKTDEGITYALASYNVDFTEIPYAESLIFKYDDSSPYPVAIFDVHDDFDENLVSQYGTPNTNDIIHLNSIDYVEESNELIVSSQSQSVIAALDADDGSVVWVIQDDESNIENPDKSLEIVNADSFEQTSGQHTAFVNNNSKYDEQRDSGKLILSIFNNNNCKNDEGVLQWKTYAEEADPSVCTYDTSDVLIYAIDEEANTVEQIDSYVVDNQKADIMSAVFNTPSDNLLVHFSLGAKSKSYLIDNEGNTLVEFEVQDYEGNGYYRTIFKEYSELSRLLDEV